MWGCHGSWLPIPLWGDVWAQTAHAYRHVLAPGPGRATDLPMNWEQREERRGKKKMGPVSQLWPFMPRAFGPSSKGIGFAEANDDTSTSSGAGSACCWRRATGVKKYCGHLIIDSLFLHYGRAQRPQLRLRSLCTHHTRTHKGKQSLPQRARPRTGSTTRPSTGPAGTKVSWQRSLRRQFQGCSKDASSISQSLHQGITTLCRDMAPWLRAVSRLPLPHSPASDPSALNLWMGHIQLPDDR